MRILSSMFAALCGVALSASVAAEPRAVAGEWQIKSAFIYNFTRFVEWPDTALATPSQPIVIGVLGEQELARELQTTVAGRNVNGRSIEVRAVRTIAEARATQLLYVTAPEEARYAAMRSDLAESPVLTVGESPSFSVTGTIGFVQEGEKLRFEINVDIAERSHLKISSQLQKLAIAIRRTQ